MPFKKGKIPKGAKPFKKGELIHEFVDKIVKEDFLQLAQREFDLMSVVLASDEARNLKTELNIEYFPC